MSLEFIRVQGEIYTVKITKRSQGIHYRVRERPEIEGVTHGFALAYPQIGQIAARKIAEALDVAVANGAVEP